ncbi:MAG: hypothetical protein V4732_18845 [Pseudomonadota bacterium]
MGTLQNGFIYEGNPALSPVSKISLNFKIPIYDYFESENQNSDMFKRRVIDSEIIALDLDLHSRSYRIEIPESFIPGKDDSTLMKFNKYFMYSIDSKKLDNFSTTIEVEYGVDKGNKISSKSFTAIYFFKPIPQKNRMLGGVDFDKENLVLINKAAYEKLLAKLNNLLQVQDDFYLLEIILKLIDFNSEFPFLTKKVSNESRNSIFRLLGSDNPEPLDIILKNFPDLFDFPLSIPEIKTIEAGGKFTVFTSDNSEITKNDLSFYGLFLDYTVDDGKNTYQSISVDLSKSDSNIQNNGVNFSFTDSKKIILNNILDPITVKVKGFDGAILWSKKFALDSAELKELNIGVPLLKPVRLTPLKTGAATDVNKKLRGQILAYSKECSLKDISVIIQAKKEGAETFAIVGSAKTDNSGNFFMPYPFGQYTAAQAITSLTPNDPVSIAVSANNENNQTIADDFLFLLVKDYDCSAKKEEDCDCDSPKKASRLPDHEDLIKSDEYSQDLGGSCVNLSTPNRTLSEYNYQAVVRTSDPDVANYTLMKTIRSTPGAYAINVSAYLNHTSDKNPIDVSYNLVPSAGKIERKPIDLNNAVKWQDDPDDKQNLQLYQAVTIATGHILHYKSKFKADGYSLGDLLYSLALAPGQKKEIVVFDSTHTLLGSETQQSTQRESLAANIVNERSITDQLGGNLNEAMQGQSSSTTSGISAGGGLGFSYGGFGASLGVSGGSSTTDANASQNSAKNVSQFFDEKLKQAIMQNSESFRQLNSSVITTVKENQRYSATSEVVANHNHCHALTILYFEVLRHFAVYQELSSVEECVFVPFLMTNFTQENIYKWRDVLAPHLLPMPSNTYLSNAAFGGGSQHPLLRAFDANERIKTHYATVDFPKGSYNEDRVSNLKGYITIRIKLEKPGTFYDRIKTAPLINTQTDFGDFLSRMGDALFGKTSPNRPDMNDYVKVDPNFSSVAPKDCIRAVKFDGAFFDLAFTATDKALWAAYAKLLGGSKSDSENIATMLNTYFFGKLLAEWDDIFNHRIAPDLFSAILPNINFEPMINGKSISSDFSTSERYNGGEKLIRLNYDGKTIIKRNEFAEYITLKATGIDDLDNRVLLNVETVHINYSTSYYHGTLFSGYSGNDLIDGAELYIPENSDEKRNPKKEDIFLVTKLIEHLNGNLEYYNKVLWYRLDQDRRYMLLDGFGIELYDSAGNKQANLRSLASVVKNQLITVAGNSLVFPVAAGYKVSNSFISEADPHGSQDAITALFDHYKPVTPIEPYRISVPSRGVFAEALQSYCNACEKIEDDRLQDWNKFPNIDEPTPFAPITVPTPTVTDWKAAFKDFAPPMVNIQNAPALPTPGAGLSGLSEVLGKSGTFKDITGLDATQQTALKTYLSNQDNAKAFAEMAKELAMQSHNTQHSDKIADSIRNSPELSKEEKTALIKSHHQQQIDGGAARNKQDIIEAKKLETSPIKSVSDIGNKGGVAEGSEFDSNGNLKSLKVGPNPDLDLTNVDNRSRQPAALQGGVTDAFLQSIAAVNFNNSTDINNYFQNRTGQHFIDWFNATLSGQGDWVDTFVDKKGVTQSTPKRIAGAKLQILKQRFTNFWDNIPMIFGEQIGLIQFVCLMSLAINELNGNLKSVTETGGGGRNGHKGLAYLFDFIEGIKSSYNVAPNKTALECFNNSEFIEQHEQLPLGAQLKKTNTPVWKQTTYPSSQFSTEENRKLTGFIMQADFYKYRGRGIIQITWRNAYEQLVNFIKTGYTGTNTTILEFRNTWQNLSSDSVLWRSSDEDWDRLFEDLEFVCHSINVFNRWKGGFLTLNLTVEELNGFGQGSIYNVGSKMNGDVYAKKFRRRVIQILNALGNQQSTSTGGGGTINL